MIYINKRLIKAKSVEIQIKYQNTTYRLAPEFVWQIQIVAISSFALYGAKLWLKCQKNHKYKIQQLINRKVQMITKIYPSTSIQVLINELELVLA